MAAPPEDADARTAFTLRRRDDESLNSALRLAAVIGAVLFPAFALSDFVLGGMPAVLRVLSLRLVAGAFFACVAASTWLPRADRRAPLVFHASLLVGTAFTMLASVRIEAPRSGTQGGILLLVMTLAAIATRLRRAVPLSVLMLLTIVVIQQALGTPWADRFLLLSFVAPSLGVACLLVALRERDQKATYEAELRLRAQREAFEREARTDVLTGVANRRAFLDLAQVAFAGARRYARDLSLLVLDVDYFKRVNDVHGHAGGDAVLVQLARSIQVVLRTSDTLGRLGGEEFGVLLPETDAAGARIVAERVRAVVAAARIHHEGQVLRATVSIGAATLGPDDTLATLQTRADRALYRAKAGGRDRVEAEHREPLADEAPEERPS